MANEIAINVKGVYKDFRLPHEKVNSIKSVVTGLTKRSKRSMSYETQHALKDINFEIKKGEFFGIVGRNGSGKSTLLKILAGIYQPTAGKVKTSGKLVPFIELGVGFNPELTGRENVYLNGALLGFTPKEVDDHYKRVVEFAELEEFMDQKLKNYSSGMQVRLAFAVATTAKAEILLVDEVLAVGDTEFQRKCFDYFQELKGGNTTVVFVTHDMNAVREYCDRAILIEKNKIVAMGSADEVSEKYTKLFLESHETDSTTSTETRYGDGSIKYTNVSLPQHLTAGQELVIKVDAEAMKDLTGCNFGFSIRNAAGNHLLGTNTRIKKKKIGNIKAGDIVSLEWRLPNVFNDGTYYFDPAIVYKADTQVADWWEGAAIFKCTKEDRTPYLVNPDIECRVEVK